MKKYQTTKKDFAVSYNKWKSGKPKDLKPTEQMTDLEIIQEARQIMRENQAKVSVRTRLLLKDLEERLKEGK